MNKASVCSYDQMLTIYNVVYIFHVAHWLQSILFLSIILCETVAITPEYYYNKRSSLITCAKLSMDYNRLFESLTKLLKSSQTLDQTLRIFSPSAEVLKALKEWLSVPVLRLANPEVRLPIPEE